MRYGISVYGSVRLNDCDPKPVMYHELQVALNNAMRIAAGKRLADRVPISSLVSPTKITTVNRMAAADKLMLIWQGLNDPNSPLSDVLTEGVDHAPTKSTRARTRGDIRLATKTTLGQRNFPYSSVCLWNKVDPSLRSIQTKSAAKLKIREIVNSLPL